MKIKIAFRKTVPFLVGIFYGMVAQGQVPRSLPANYTSTGKINYIRGWTPTAPDTSSSRIITRPLKDVKQSTQYYDGLGKIIQTVGKKGSLVTGGDSSDLVTTVLYDQFGRQQYTYLPFSANDTGGNVSIRDGLFKINPLQQQVKFYNNHFTDQPGEANVGANKLNWAYGQTVFEASPLNRVKEAFSPGSSWIGSSGRVNENDHRSVRNKFWYNTALDSVRLWVVNDVINDFGTYSAVSRFAAGELVKNVAVDEHGKQSIEFKDKRGRVVLKKVQLSTSDNGTGSGHTGWLCIYYVFDNLNNLRLVIQPKGVQLLLANNWNINDYSGLILSEQCFRYEYDARSRLIRKKEPSGGEARMVYDSRDRLVLSQDKAMRTISHQWYYTKYDNLNRPISTGLITDNAKYDSLTYHVTAASNSSDYPNLSNYPGYEELTNTFYDRYTWLSTYGNPLTATYDNTNDTYLFTASNGDYPYPQANVPCTLVNGYVTGTRTKVLGTSTYLYSVNIYNEKGRIIQTKSINITTGQDIATIQYSWNGMTLVVVNKQQKSGINPQVQTVVSRLDYDELGRLLTIRKTVNSNLGNKNEQVIVSNSYNAMGQAKTKKLGNPASPLETITYDYNIRGWALGINRPFTKDTTSTANHFGYELAYDKNNLSVHNNVTPYADTLFNGNIAGMLWKSSGDNMVRRYDYSYDAINRLTGASFKQFTGNTFNLNSGIDFSTTGLTYDVNGNILSMTQRGWKAGISDVIDSLKYNYYAQSNRLLNVIDHKNDISTSLGDFRASAKRMQTLPAGKTANTVDYDYDVNGNLSKDLNKDLGDTLNGGILYNHLNLPRYISVKKADGSSKGNIAYIYDALGNKLKKVVTDSSILPARITTTLYLSGSIFENDTLQFIGHEEGRLRYQKKYFLNEDSAYQFNYDYFLKDHLGNVRMVLTEQKDTSRYLASMELTYRTKEDLLFRNISQTAVAKSTISGYPTDTTVTSPNDYVAKVSGSGNKTGPAIVLRVMSGDKVDIGVKYFFKSGGTPGNNDAPVTDLLSVLAAGIIGSVGDVKGTSAILNSSSNSPLLGALNSFRSINNPNQGTTPKAYLNWIMLDEQLKYVAAGSNANAVTIPNAIQTLAPIVNIGKNGFLYIYVSNETPNWDVFFDNLVVKHYTSPETEETHYYPFGLTMAGISAKAVGKLDNKYEYNGIEHNENFDVNMYDAQYRNLDPQIGRFWQVDPKPSNSISLYAFAFNNPIRYSDPLGDTAILSINNSAALGLGHQVLIFQDKSKDWFVYSMGAEGDGQRAVSGGNVAGDVLLKPLNTENFKGLPEGSLSANQIVDFLGNNKLGATKLSDAVIVNTTQKQDETIAANAIQSKKDFESGKEKYNLYTNNSTVNTMKVVNTNTGLDLPVVTRSPGGTHRSIKYELEFRKATEKMTPEQKKAYIQQKWLENARRLLQ